MSRSDLNAAGWWHAAAVVIGIVVVLLLPPGHWRAAAEVPVHLLSVVAVHLGLRRYRPAAVVAWRTLAAALGCFAGSSAAEAVQLAGAFPEFSRQLEASLDIVGYGALLLAAMAALVAGRGRWDRDAWADSGTLLLAAGLAVATFADHAGQAARGVGELGIGFPMLGAVVIIAGTRLALPDKGCSFSGLALFAAGGLALAGYAVRLIPAAVGAAPVLDVLPLLAVVAVTLAARHPSMAFLGGAPNCRTAMTTGGVVGAGAALLISPALMLLWTIRHGGNGYVLGIGSGILTGLALWRLGKLASEREQARAALGASEARLRVLLENAPDVIAIVDATGRISYASPAIEALLGQPAGAFLGHRALALVDRGDRARLHAAVGGVQAAGPVAGQVVDADVRLRRSDGGTRWVEVKISNRVDASGVNGWVLNLREVTGRKLREEQLRHQACTDPLTGLLNRWEFWNRLAQTTSDRESAPGVLFVDLDDFKSVNDSLGHGPGDELLVAVAGRLASCVRAADSVARLGGDEFAVLLADADTDRAHRVGDRILRQLRQPVHLAGHTVAVTASIGGALAVPGDSPQTLLHRADTAMYAAKRRGKNHCELLDRAGRCLSI